MDGNSPTTAGMAHPHTPETGMDHPVYYAENAGNIMTDRDFFLLLQTLGASTQNTEDDCSLLEKFNWEENNFSENNTLETSEENRKRKIWGEEDIIHDTVAYKRTRPEVCGMSDQLVSNFSDRGFFNPDSQTNEITMSSQIAFDSEILPYLYSEFPNCEKSNPKNQDLKPFDYLGKEANLYTGQMDTACKKNSFQKQNSACKITDIDVDKIMNGCSDDILPVPDTSRCLENNSPSKVWVEKVQSGFPLKQQPPAYTEKKQLNYLACKKTISEHVEIHGVKDMSRCCRWPFMQDNFNCLQMDVHAQHAWLKENVECNNLDSISKRGNVCSADDRLTVSDTIQSLENNSHLQLAVEKVQNGSPLKQQPPAYTEKNQSNYLACKKTISEHVEIHDGKDLSRCCCCPFMQDNLNCLQVDVPSQHAWLKENAECKNLYSTISKTGNVCSVDGNTVPGAIQSLENNSHLKLVVEKVRNRSGLKQQPKIKTEEIHLRCLACRTTISEHVKLHEGKRMYRCCQCQFIHCNFNHLQIHVYDNHTKPFYCNFCRVKHSKSDSHTRGGTCDECNQNFECKFQLEEHYMLIHKDFLEANCRICKRKLDEHSSFCKGVKYQCCVTKCKIRFNSTSSLNQHLSTHYPLKLSKCELCGHHFKLLQDHIQNIHPFCKSCGKRFVNIYFLYEHLCE